MKVTIKKTVDIVVDIPDHRVKDFFGENCSEMDFITWADNNMYLSCPDVDNNIEDMEEKDIIEAWVNHESLTGITVENGMESLKDSYTEDEINDIITERDRIESCYECGGMGDDYSYDSTTGELVSNCDNCPNNIANRDD